MLSSDSEILAEAKELLPDTIDLRRRIHRHPELGNDLPKTKAAVLESLEGLGLEIVHSLSTSGLVATLHGSGEGPTILLRGDMDALPMPEDSGLEFASEIENRMHACGHDTHTAMLASAAHLLSRYRGNFKGKVKFMFQPGEEDPGGAEPMIEEGLLDAGGHPDAAFAIHISPNMPAGVIASRPGNLLAAADSLFIKLWGQGGHGSMPHEANDPVPVACEIVQAMQTFVSRKFGAFEPVVITVGRIAAGTANNIIPEIAEMDVTLRSFSPIVRDRINTGLNKLVHGVAAAHGMRVEFDLHLGYPPTVNDAGFLEFLRQTTIKEFGAEAFFEMPEPVMGAEDFSYVLERMPGAMAFLGVAPDGIDPATGPTCHSNRLVVNEEAMAMGVAAHTAVALNYLNQ
jgi:hippurate hydrolase